MSAGPIPGVAGAILAGGRSRRMGTDKAFVPINGRPMLEHVIDRLRGQASPIVLSANGDLGRFRSYSLPITRDRGDRQQGPLSGILAALHWARDVAQVSDVVTVPVDSPFIPKDFVARLLACRGGSEVAVARSRGVTHPTVGLWPVALCSDLERWLAEGRERAVHRWIESCSTRVVDFDDEDRTDPFFNVNTPADAVWARHLAAGVAERPFARVGYLERSL